MKARLFPILPPTGLDNAAALTWVSAANARFANDEGGSMIGMTEVNSGWVENEAQKSAVYFSSDGHPLAEIWYSDLGTWSVTGFAGERTRECTGKGAEAVAREIALEIAQDRINA